MHTLSYIITNLSPLVVSSKYGDMNMVTTEKHIPGRAVQGILARQFIRAEEISRDNAYQNDIFYRWFLSGAMEMSPAYIVSRDENDEESVHYPIPFSIQNIKNERRIIDLLHVDDDFDEQTEGLNGFCRLDETTIYLETVGTTLNFHHARDREKGTSKKGVIFNYESISPKQKFQGTISGSKEDLDRLLAICGKKWTAHLGRSRNAQYGKIDFEITETKPQPVSVETDMEKEISLTLLSDTIILNENGFSTTDMESFEKYLRRAKVKTAFSKQGQVESFESMWKLNRPSETCFLAGSCFRLDVSGCETGDLAELQNHGIGERIGEGFGRCVLGLQTEEHLSDRTVKPDLHKPQWPMPHKAKDIITELVKASIKKAVELEAMEVAQSFRRLPSRSLCGKLEAMVKGRDERGFVEMVKALRKPAENQLRNSGNKKESLYDFLISKKVSVKDVFSRPTNDGLAEICREANLDPGGDKVFEKELYQLYFCAFFLTMRKALKTQGDNSHDV
ncbi:MAG: hypothetical protein B6I30_09835 [Desulfobacteraceae bacterium 4572_187]|nr:MAG: hypothetical protein B6I30_09835 [Desulfobacteraceae bacterium 4572_187]